MVLLIHHLTAIFYEAIHIVILKIYILGDLAIKGMDSWAILCGKSTMAGL